MQVGTGDGGEGMRVRRGAGIVAVAKRVLRVSEAANERAVRALHIVANHVVTLRLLQDMLHMGVMVKL